MAEIYYAVCLSASVVLMLIYCFIYHKHFDVHISMIFVLIPINNLGHFLMNRAVNLEEAMIANKVIYMSGCYLILMITLVVFILCDIKINRYIRLIMFFMSTLVFGFAMLIGENKLFYKTVEFERVNGKNIITKEYGPLHSTFYVLLTVYFLLGMGAIAYSYFKKNQVSRKFIYLLALPETLAVLNYFVSRKLSNVSNLLPDVELLPFTYIIAMVVYLIIVHRLVLYDISDTVIDTMIQKGDTGFISFDFGMRYLGSNETAKGIFPELCSLTVDKPIDKNEFMSKTALIWLESFKENKRNDKFYYQKDDKIYLIDVNFLSDGSRNRGYQLIITDDTKNQQYIALLDSFNTELRQEVAEKTKHIVEMHDNLILSMATMVESRDNSTGGHIRRTSEGVRILIDEIRNGDDFELDEEFCKDLIKAAPMHDLGKIAVKDEILCKNGRFTDEEYAIMKTHAAEGARIVHEILKGTDDKRFHIIAENVAHYHHERWDGSGYPDGLKGEEIPLEARIMAIADVYDALVSKRVYKEKMSFEQADKIITEGMGKHFDKRLEPYYIKARPRLEEYYSSIEC